MWSRGQRSWGGEANVVNFINGPHGDDTKPIEKQAKLPSKIFRRGASNTSSTLVSGFLRKCIPLKT